MFKGRIDDITQIRSYIFFLQSVGLMEYVAQSHDLWVSLIYGQDKARNSRLKKNGFYFKFIIYLNQKIRMKWWLKNNKKNFFYDSVYLTDNNTETSTKKLLQIVLVQTIINNNNKNQHKTLK